MISSVILLSSQRFSWTFFHFLAPCRSVHLMTGWGVRSQILFTSLMPSAERRPQQPSRVCPTPPLWSDPCADLTTFHPSTRVCWTPPSGEHHVRTRGMRWWPSVSCGDIIRTLHVFFWLYWGQKMTTSSRNSWTQTPRVNITAPGLTTYGLNHKLRLQSFYLLCMFLLFLYSQTFLFLIFF